MIEHLTIRDAYGDGYVFEDDFLHHTGGGVRIINGGSPRLNQVKIINNKTASSGAGVWVESSSPVFTLCRFESNSMIQNPAELLGYGHGGGLYAWAKGKHESSTANFATIRHGAAAER